MRADRYILLLIQRGLHRGPVFDGDGREYLLQGLFPCPDRVVNGKDRAAVGEYRLFRDLTDDPVLDVQGIQSVRCFRTHFHNEVADAVAEQAADLSVRAEGHAQPVAEGHPGSRGSDAVSVDRIGS